MRGGLPARAAPPGPGKQAAARRRRWVAWEVAVLAAGILLAGSLGTYVAARAIAAPRAAVEQSAALPVRNSVGQKADEVRFLPWQVFEDALPEPAGEVDPAEVMQTYEEPMLALLSCGYTRKVEWEAMGGFGSYFSVSARQGDFAYVKGAPFMVSCQPGPEAPLTAFPALLDAATGTSPGGLHSAHFVMQLRPDLVASPTPEQLEAARHAVLQDLYALTALQGSDSQQAAPLCGLQALLPLLEEYLGRIDFAGSSTVTLSMVQTALSSPEFAGLFRESLETTSPESPQDARIEQALQSAFLAWQSIEFQLVTLDSTILLLFMTGYDGSSSALGVYYDPVLGCYSGFGIQ